MSPIPPSRSPTHSFRISLFNTSPPQWSARLALRFARISASQPGLHPTRPDQRRYAWCMSTSQPTLRPGTHDSQNQPLRMGTEPPVGSPDSSATLSSLGNETVRSSYSDAVGRSDADSDADLEAAFEQPPPAYKPLPAYKKPLPAHEKPPPAYETLYPAPRSRIALRHFFVALATRLKKALP